MAAAYRARPSGLIGLKSGYAAYCLDEAVADYIGRLQAGQKLRPPKAADNRELIDKMTGG